MSVSGCEGMCCIGFERGSVFGSFRRVQNYSNFLSRIVPGNKMIQKLTQKGVNFQFRWRARKWDPHGCLWGGIRAQCLASVSVPTTAAMKFQILQSFELFFRILKIYFLEKVTGAWVSELSSPLGSKLDPSAGPFLVTFGGLLYTFLKACLNLGTFLSPFFGPTGDLDFGFGCVQKNEFFEKLCNFFRKKWLIRRALVTKNWVRQRGQFGSRFAGQFLVVLACVL